MLNLEQFIDDCQRALAEARAERAVRELVERVVSEPAALLQALGEPKRAEIQTLHRSAQLSVLNVIWAPGMSIMPHDHRMWAVIGIYTGREDNVFWRRLPDAPAGQIEQAGARTLESEEAVSLGRDIIHSVRNPLAVFTGALHVYGGDFFATERTQRVESGVVARTEVRCAEGTAHVRGGQRGADSIRRQLERRTGVSVTTALNRARDRCPLGPRTGSGLGR